MHSRELREILLVRAVEESDPSGRWLPWAERERAARDALRATGLATEDVSREFDDDRVPRALSLRAAQLLPPLQERHPVLLDVRVGDGWPGWAACILVVVALAFGYALSALNGSHRINILALPLLGLLAWNLVVYAWIVVTAIRRRFGAAPGSPGLARVAVRGIGRRLAPWVARSAQVDQLVAGAIQRYVSDWSRLGAPRLAQQARLWLHLAAAVVAVGLVAGLYQRGLVNAYVAGWESTWLGPRQVSWLIEFVYGPAAAWAGITLPATIDEVARLQFRPDGLGGESAAPWIHLIAVAVLVVVILPRLVLALLAALQGWRLDGDRRLPPDLRPYARSVLGAGGQGLAQSLVVVPYAYQPSASTLSALETQLKATYGRGAHLVVQPPVAYGDEDALTERLGQATGGGCILLFSLAATPEAENHGRMLDAWRGTAEVAGTRRAYVDELPLAARFGADPTLARRIDERRALWREFGSSHGVDLGFVAAP